MWGRRALSFPQDSPGERIKLKQSKRKFIHLSKSLIYYKWRLAPVFTQYALLLLQWLTDRPLLMTMSPLFKEETSFTIYIRANLQSVLFPKTGSFSSSYTEYCYNRDNKNAIFRIIQVIISSNCFHHSSKGSSRIANYGQRNLRVWRLFQQLSQLFQQRPHMLICNLRICISNDALQLIKYKSIMELNAKQINHIIKKRFLYTLGKSEWKWYWDSWL